MKRKITIIGVVLILTFSAIGYVYFFIYNKQHPDYTELKADFELEASAFYQEFKNAADAARSKYTGKMVQLNGQPARLESVDSLVIAVFVFGEGMFGDEGIRCTFMADNSKDLTDVSALTGYAIKGYCTGYNDTDVILEKCSLVKIN